MAYQPPQRWASPNGNDLADILHEPRNTEARHRELLESSAKAHTQLRQEAERVLQESILREQTRRVLEEKRREQERIQAEQKLAEERQRLNELKKKVVEIPPLLPDSKSEAAPAVNGNLNKSVASQVPSSANPAASNAFQQPAAQAAAIQPSVNPFGTKAPGQGFTSITSNAPIAQPKPVVEPAKQPSTALGLNALLNGNSLTNGSGPANTTPKPAPTPAPQAPQPDRYTVIHQNLKILRKTMMDQAKVNRALKERMGDMRREIRKSVGQLTGGAPGVNRTQVW